MRKGSYMQSVNKFSERERIAFKGGNIKPITRREMFIVALYNDTQSVPKPITEDEKALMKLVEYVRGLKTKGEENE